MSDTVDEVVNTAPVEPTPVEPTPVEPTPVEPTPVEPTPVEPTPVEPIFYVVCVTDGQPTKIETCFGDAALSACVLAFREQQRADLSLVTHLYIFEGRQWFILKGPAWQLTDCVRTIVLEEPPTPVRCEDGGLRESAPAEHLLPPPVAAGDVDATPLVTNVTAVVDEDDDDSIMPDLDGSSDAEIDG